MANSKQARKRARQAETRRVLKASQRSMVRTYIKRVIKAINTGTAAPGANCTPRRTRALLFRRSL